MKNIISALLLASLLGGFAAQEPLMKITMSGWPETTFESTTVEIVKGKIAQECLNLGETIEDSSANQIVCSAPMSDTMDIISANLILNGNAYSFGHCYKERYVLFPVGQDVKVTMQETMQLQMMGGAVRIGPYKNNREMNRVQILLDSLAAN